MNLIGNALVSNTTICEASSLVLDTDRERPSAHSDERRAVDLMTLIDAVVLHEQLFYLPASLPDDVDQLALRNRLLASGVLTPLPGDDDELVAQALFAALSTAELPEGSGRPPVDFGRVKTSIEIELGIRQPTSQELADGFDMGPGPYHDDTYVRDWEQNSFEDIAQIVQYLEHSDSGYYESVVPALRTMFYVFSSEHHRIPYLPSVNVESVARSFPNYFDSSIRAQLYDALSSALRAALEEVEDEFTGEMAFVPPFAAIVLDRAATPTEITNETLALRQEYADLRRRMRELELERYAATTINSRQAARRHIDQLSKEVARPFEHPSQMRLETVLRYVPDVADLAANPTRPASWARLLLGMPIDALMDWYRRRPIAKLVRTAKTVASLKYYERLLSKHFGEDVSQQTVELQRHRVDT